MLSLLKVGFVFTVIGSDTVIIFVLNPSIEKIKRFPFDVVLMEKVAFHSEVEPIFSFSTQILTRGIGFPVRLSLTISFICAEIEQVIKINAKKIFFLSFYFVNYICTVLMN